MARQDRHGRLVERAAADPAHEEAATAEAAHLVRQAVAALPADQRRVVELRYFRGLSYREVAVAEGIPDGTAKSRVANP